MDAMLRRLIEEHGSLREVAYAIDAVNSRRANSLVQDSIYRRDYEQTMGGCLDRLREVVDAIRDGKAIKPWARKGA